MEPVYSIDPPLSKPEPRPVNAVSLWDHIFDSLEGYLCTFTGQQDPHKNNNLVFRDQRHWKWPTEKQAAAAYLIEQSMAGRDAYFGVHLFKTPENREKENTAPEILSLWADGDGAAVPADWPQPTAIVESSPGRHHYYWRLTRPISPKQAEELSRRIAYGMDADKGKWGLGTVLRAPGTRNYKREVPTEVTGVIYE